MHFYDGENLPVNIPPVNKAWDDMRRRLDEEDSDAVPVSIIKMRWDRRYFAPLSGLVLLLLVAGWWFLTGTDNKHNAGDHLLSVKRNNNPVNNNTIPSLGSSSIASETAVNNKGESEKNVLKKNTSTTRYTINKYILPTRTTRKRNMPTKTAALQNMPSADSIASGIAKQNTVLPKHSDSCDNKKIITSFLVNPGDTLLKTETQAEEEKEPGLIQAGLQWNLQLPFSGAQQYFAGPGGSSQPYYMAFPTVWISFRWDNQRLSINMAPFASMVLPDRAYAVKVQPIDLLTTVTETYTLNKVFGFAAGLRYDKQLHGPWWLGGGIENYWWRQGTIRTDRVTEKRVAATDPSGTKTSNSFYSAMKDSNWVYFEKFQANANIQLSYEQERWQIGLRIGLFVMPFYKTYGMKTPLQSELFFRLKVFHSLPGKTVTGQLP